MNKTIVITVIFCNNNYAIFNAKLDAIALVFFLLTASFLGFDTPICVRTKDTQKKLNC